MYKLDEQITRAFFRYEEAQRQRLWMMRLWHPELMNWVKRGGPPPITETKRIRQEELAKMGFGEEHYQRMCELQKTAGKQLEDLAGEHPLWDDFEHIRGIGPLTCGKFVAAGGDITRPPTASAFWKGMGIDVLPDGTVPRRQRRSTAERRVPALPHVTKVGEQIRQMIVRSNRGKLRALYDQYREYYDAKYPNRAKTFNFRAAVRVPQKILYACAWEQWRLAYGLEAPWPYAFAILKHPDEHRITMADLYDDKTE